TAGLRPAFFQGFLFGFFILPSVAAVLAVIGATVWLLKTSLEFIGLVIGILLTPFRWIASWLYDILIPVLEVLLAPFAWIGQNLILPLLELLWSPFQWLIDAIGPLLQLLWAPFSALFEFLRK